ncbi:MAG: methyltransferase domain-containing protein [Oscillospiraceae bacterium]|nr:methyltransferase domain-containing protein [Oscillospiraceae bacterium]MBQ7802238.1 methyltransferase domain-containing protein [Oscillospiraceae bacterium]
MELICPVCGSGLDRVEREYRCENRHSFDIARQGYVNLLTVQQKRSLHPGDTREQVLSRRAFLDAGYYAPIAKTLCDTAKDLGAAGPILDVGCGEGYYSARLAGALDAELTGLDISKEAVRCAAGKYKNALWICGTAAHLPVADRSAGIVTSLFALTMPEEFRRVLKPGGYYFQVLAAEDHLLGLKSIIYPELLHKEKNTVPELPGFRLVRSVPIRFDFTVEGEQVRNLLSMTPHVYRISKEGAQRLARTQTITDTASCVLNVYRADA